MAGQLVEPRILGREPVLNRNVGQNLSGRGSRRDKIRLRIDCDLFCTAERLDGQVDGRRTAFNIR